LRGSEHFKWLEAAWQAYTPAFQSELVIVPIRDGVELRLGKLSDPPRKEWSIVIGDCVQNFRSALDHMVWQLAPQKARVTTGTTLAFPIFAHPKQYARSAPSRIASLPAAARKVIESVQPFHQGAEYVKDPLWQLSVLSNIDKHRRLHIGDVSLEAVTLDARGTRMQTLWRSAPPSVRAKSGMPIARVADSEIRRFGEPKRVQVQPSAVLTIAFDESGDVTGEGVIGTLRRIRGRVGEVLHELDSFVSIA